MITLDLLYYIVGFLFLIFGILNFLNQKKTLRARLSGGVFWTSYSATFLLANVLSDFIIGCIVILLAIIAGLNWLKPEKIEVTAKEKEYEIQSAQIYKHKLFIPALLVPLITLAGTFLLPYCSFFEAKNATLISLILAIVFSFILACFMFKASAKKAIKDATHTMDNISWAALLPQILATLGVIFVSTGMGNEVEKLLSNYISLNNSFMAVAVYCICMALLTMIMGNAFAAFPVISAAIALPVLISNMHANPAIVGAIGMLSGFCGTLMTPMAANFNTVPAVLLELDSKNGVIRAQFLSGLLLLVANIFLMYFLAFNF
ncbi:DUF979 domain-containing protein [Campylobacter taeniopygiae]|uniref:DUF979 domain-containing protein n=1 Tax=Campylobacter taeniopygiae TaxID=2510188 RepID=A0ABY2TII9_9BACT|nr:DUF979 domain-containing protein [Campylobacter taeniopygiae]TKX33673.1 DUF979 domain-containing protein [Campylobacter taeniopygiae]